MQQGRAKSGKLRHKGETENRAVSHSAHTRPFGLREKNEEQKKRRS
jgi:hypothetical protein